MTRRLVVSLSAEDRLVAASSFLKGFAGREVLILSATRTAGDELVHRCAAGGDGVFGVHRFTPPQLAYLLASERLAREGNSFVTGVAMEAVAARVVQDCRDAGKLAWFDPVATTTGFFRALAATIQELRLNDIDANIVRPAGPSGPDLASALTLFEENLRNSGVADIAAAYKVAIAATQEAGFRLRGFPLLILDHIGPSHLEQKFVRVLATSASHVLATASSRDLAAIETLRQIIGVVEEPVGVEGSRALDRLRIHVFERSAPGGELDDSVEFLSATDEGRECAEIARSILELGRGGKAFDQVAVVLRNPEVYQPSLEDAFRRAEIPAFFSLGARRPNPAGRALLTLLACAAEGLSASRFSEYLSLGQAPRADNKGAPAPKSPGWVPIQGELFPEIARAETVEIQEDENDESPVISGSLRAPYQWERLLVDAAVIGGRDRWVRRLDGLANEFAEQIAEKRRSGDDVEYLERQLGLLKNLRRFAIPIIDYLGRLPARANWGEWLETLENLAIITIRQPEHVLAVLGELRPMSDLGPISLDEVREVLTHRLTFLRTETPERRYGKVFVTTAPEIAGLAFDFVFLPGLAEDNFPKKAFEDPLLLDDARLAISPWLMVQNTRNTQERQLLHIVAGAARTRLWISYPRMDLGQGRSRNPSFYALDILRAITGSIPDLRQLQQRSTAQTQSQIGWPAPRNAAVAIDDAEYDLSIISSRQRGRYLVLTNPSLARSLRARSARWGRQWSESDGIIEPDDILTAYRPISKPYSATALQNFAACPYRFLLYSIHKIQPREEMAPIERMDALTRGSLVHSTQFRLLTELRALKLLPITPDNLTAVIAIADRTFDQTADEYREKLAPAILRIWESQIEDIRWDLRGWLREMSTPSNSAWTPSWFELSFGLAGDRERDPQSATDAVELPGVGVRVRGAIDMIEERDGAIRITDHKTGRPPSRHPGVTGQGEVLQPILYAQAAEVILGKPAQSARLFYCSERGGYQSVEIPVDEHSRKLLGDVIHLIDRSIAEGFLPAAPRDNACLYCDYKSICGPYEETRIRRKQGDRLSLLQELRRTP